MLLIPYRVALLHFVHTIAFAATSPTIFELVVNAATPVPSDFEIKILT